MLFAVWTENRATEEDSHSVSSERSAGGVSVLSRHDGVITPAPAALLKEPSLEKKIMEEKPEKLAEVDETQGGAEDQRPVVFKSTFWEILCIMSLVSAQLTNV
jgi:hypothetical protein